MQAMEEVRMLSNLSTESQPLLQIILVGQPKLRSYIQQGNLRQLAQRISLSDRQQDWGAEQQAVQAQEGSAAPEGAQSLPDQAWQQMQGQLQGLKQRLAWLESEVRDLGQAHKDQIGAWLEGQLQHYKKENRRLSDLYGQSRQKNQELQDRLQALQPDEAEKTSAATNTGSHRQQPLYLFQPRSKDSSWRASRRSPRVLFPGARDCFGLWQASAQSCFFWSCT